LIVKLNAELTLWGIEFSNKRDLIRLRELLKKDLVRCWSEDDQMRGSGFTAADVASFLSISDEMMTKLSNQKKIMAEKHDSAVLDGDV
jgi:hypothetical protein